MNEHKKTGLPAVYSPVTPEEQCTLQGGSTASEYTQATASIGAASAVFALVTAAVCGAWGLYYAKRADQYAEKYAEKYTEQVLDRQEQYAASLYEKYVLPYVAPWL